MTYPRPYGGAPGGYGAGGPPGVAATFELDWSDFLAALSGGGPHFLYLIALGAAAPPDPGVLVSLTLLGGDPVGGVTPLSASGTGVGGMPRLTGQFNLGTVPNAATIATEFVTYLLSGPGGGAGALNPFPASAIFNPPDAPVIVQPRVGFDGRTRVLGLTGTGWFNVQDQVFAQGEDGPGLITPVLWGPRRGAVRSRSVPPFDYESVSAGPPPPLD